jgi:hypothetical protein
MLGLFIQHQQNSGVVCLLVEVKWNKFSYVLNVETFTRDLLSSYGAHSW